MSSPLVRLCTVLCSLSLGLVSAFAAELPALAQLKLRAEAGDAAAQYEYAQRSRPANGTERIEWIKKSAAQGYAAAQDALASHYRPQGSNTAERLSFRREAARWASRAAFQGFAASQLKLGQYYDEGAGVSKDLIKAYMWTEIAAQNKTASITTDIVAKPQLNRLIANMSSPDIAEGHRLASAFQLPTAPQRLNPIEADLIFAQVSLTAVIQASGVSAAVINSVRFARGETKNVQIDGQSVPLTCISFDARSVQVAIPETSYVATVALSTGAKAK